MQKITHNQRGEAGKEEASAPVDWFSSSDCFGQKIYPASSDVQPQTHSSYVGHSSVHTTITALGDELEFGYLIRCVSPVEAYVILAREVLVCRFCMRVRKLLLSFNSSPESAYSFCHHCCNHTDAMLFKGAYDTAKVYEAMMKQPIDREADLSALKEEASRALAELDRINAEFEHARRGVISRLDALTAMIVDAEENPRAVQLPEQFIAANFLARH